MALKCWIPFMLVPDGDKVYKRPSVDGVRPARWKHESDTLLTTYADAVALKERTPGLAGVGLSIPSGIAIIDLDKCYDSGTIKPAASSIIDNFNSYTEKSPSRNGIHIITAAWLTGFSKHTFNQDGQSIEILTPGNFATFTGKTIGQESGITDCTPALLKMYADAYSRYGCIDLRSPRQICKAATVKRFEMNEV